MASHQNFIDQTKLKVKVSALRLSQIIESRINNPNIVLRDSSFAIKYFRYPSFLFQKFVQSVREMNSKVNSERETVIETNKRINDKYKQINHWLGEDIKNEIKKDKIPLSYSSVGAEEYGKRLTDIYDVADVHFMPYLPLKKEQIIAF